MWKFSISLLLFCMCVAFTVARPGYLHSPVLPAYEHISYEPTVVGHSYHSIPTAVSHQSQTIIHEKRPYLRPIVEHAPIYKTYAPALPLAYSPVSYGGLYDHGWSPRLSSVYDGWNGWPLK